MEKDLILLDTNIIIEILKNNKSIIDEIKAIGIEMTSVSCITVMELYYGAVNKIELRKIKEYLEAFEVIQVNHRISQLATGLADDIVRIFSYIPSTPKWSAWVWASRGLQGRLAPNLNLTGGRWPVKRRGQGKSLMAL